MSTTTSFLASQVPPPQGLSLALTLNGATPAGQSPYINTGYCPGQGPLTTEYGRRLDILGSIGGTGYGIVRGMGVTVSSGLTVTVAAGIAQVLGGLDFPATNYFCPDDQPTIFLWLKSDRSLTHALDTTPPAGDNTLLGIITTVSGAITQIDNSGVPYFVNGTLFRDVAGSIPDDTAPSLSIVTRCVDYGHAFVAIDGDYHELVHPSGQIALSQRVQTISGTLTLTKDSPPLLRINGGAADRKVLMPDPTTVPDWWSFQLGNIGATNVLNLRDHGDTTTIMSVAVGKTTVAFYKPTGGGGFAPSVPQDT